MSGWPPVTGSAGSGIVSVANRLSQELKALNDRNADLRAELLQASGELETLLCSMVDIFNPHLGGHGRRVGKLVDDLAAHLHVPELAHQNLRHAALFHDIGMLGMPRDKLYTPWAELTETERNLILLHPEMGSAQLKTVHWYKQAAPAIMAHHERWDGSGFPNHLRHDDIPIGARILAVCDTYDEMMNKPQDAPVRFEEEQVLAHLMKQRGGQFDPKVVDHFLEMIEARARAAAGIQEPTEIPRTIGQLLPGMRLTRDLLNTSGLTLLTRGTVLRDVNVLRLQGLRGANAVVEPIFVSSETVQLEIHQDVL